MRFCKDIANLLLWLVWECLIMPIKMILSPCRKLSSQSVETNFDVYLHAKNQLYLTSCLRYCKDITKLQFSELWECLTISIKTIVKIRRKTSFSFACIKSTSSFPPFLRYWREIVNLLFLVNRTCRATQT